ncbi:hypothetical protein CRUP_012050 [Coryphaenoides rupestris]|nr:hypothetical protein CRUP_012050 [Coryphaenoides rupestris]
MLLLGSTSSLAPLAPLDPHHDVSLSHAGNSTAAAREPLEGARAAADRYAALAGLDGNVCSSTNAEQGSGIAGGVTTAGGGAPGSGVGPPGHPPALFGGDRYAALAALDTVFSPSAPATSVYDTISTSQGSMYGSGTGVTSSQAQQGLPNMGQSFGPTPTNPFVAAPPAAATNPFQSNGRAAAVAAAGTDPCGEHTRVCLGSDNYLEK